MIGNAVIQNIITPELAKKVEPIAYMGQISGDLNFSMLLAINQNVANQKHILGQNQNSMLVGLPSPQTKNNGISETGIMQMMEIPSVSDMKNTFALSEAELPVMRANIKIETRAELNSVVKQGQTSTQDNNAVMPENSNGLIDQLSGGLITDDSYKAGNINKRGSFKEMDKPKIFGKRTSENISDPITMVWGQAIPGQSDDLTFSGSGNKDGIKNNIGVPNPKKITLELDKSLVTTDGNTETKNHIILQPKIMGGQPVVRPEKTDLPGKIIVAAHSKNHFIDSHEVLKLKTSVMAGDPATEIKETIADNKVARSAIYRTSQVGFKPQPKNKIVTGDTSEMQGRIKRGVELSQDSLPNALFKYGEKDASYQEPREIAIERFIRSPNKGKEADLEKMLSMNKEQVGTTAIKATAEIEKTWNMINLPTLEKADPQEKQWFKSVQPVSNRIRSGKTVLPENQNIMLGQPPKQVEVPVVSDEPVADIQRVPITNKAVGNTVLQHPLKQGEVLIVFDEPVADIQEAPITNKAVGHIISQQPSKQVEAMIVIDEPVAGTQETPVANKMAEAASHRLSSANSGSQPKVIEINRDGLKLPYNDNRHIDKPSANNKSDTIYRYEKTDTADRITINNSIREVFIQDTINSKASQSGSGLNMQREQVANEISKALEIMPPDPHEKLVIQRQQSLDNNIREVFIQDTIDSKASQSGNSLNIQREQVANANVKAANEISKTLEIMTPNPHEKLVIQRQQSFGETQSATVELGSSRMDLPKEKPIIIKELPDHGNIHQNQQAFVRNPEILGLPVSEGIRAASSLSELENRICTYINSMKLAEQSGYISISLETGDLGNIKLRVLLKDSKISATLIFDRFETMKTMELQMPDIRRNLEKNQIQVNELKFSMDEGFIGADQRNSDLYGDNADRYAAYNHGRQGKNANNEEFDNLQGRQALQNTSTANALVDLFI